MADEPTLANGSPSPPEKEHGFPEDSYTENYLEVCSYLSGNPFLADGPPPNHHGFLKTITQKINGPLYAIQKTSVMTTPKCPRTQIWQIYSRSAGRSTPMVLTSSGQDEFKFGRPTPRSASRSTPWY